MENVPVLRTYSMLELIKSFSPAIHRLLIYLMSFFSVPEKLAVDICLAEYIETTGVSIRTIGNYLSKIGNYKGKTETGLSIPLIKQYSINYRQQTLEIELNKQYIECFADQFALPTTAPQTLLTLNEWDYVAAIHIARHVAEAFEKRKYYRIEIRMKIGQFTDSCSISMLSRWRSSFLPLFISRLNLLCDIGFAHDWYVEDIDKMPIHLNTYIEKENAMKNCLIRSWTHFKEAVVVFEIEPKNWKYKV